MAKPTRKQAVVLRWCLRFEFLRDDQPPHPTAQVCLRNGWLELVTVDTGLRFGNGSPVTQGYYRIAPAGRAALEEAKGE